MELLAVNGKQWTPDNLREAIRQAKGNSEPIELLLRNDDYYKTVKIDYHGGERYPHLEATGAQDLLDQIAHRRAAEVK
jgi:hypothetical protein